MSDANYLLPRPATDIDDVALGMIHLVVNAEFASLRDALSLALADNHRLTVLLAERDETIAALNALAAKLEALCAALGGGRPELSAVAKRNAEPCDCDAYPDEEHKERCRFWAASLRVVRDEWMDVKHDSEVLP